MIGALAAHWPEYIIEGVLLGLFMASACVAVVTLEHPGSPVHRRLRSPAVRRAITGAAMGLTAVALIYSPLGARSGAHMNPATTLTFLVLGKVSPWDAAFYVLSQFIGGLAGVLVTSVLLRGAPAHASVNYAATLPRAGRARAWAAEFAIAAGMMSVVLLSSNHAPTAPYTGLFAGGLVALYITLEAPVSGMSMNPARTLASAVPARAFGGLWIYFTAPPLGMLVVGAVYTSIAGGAHCAKLHHAGEHGCIFRCGDAPRATQR